MDRKRPCLSLRRAFPNTHLHRSFPFPFEFPTVDLAVPRRKSRWREWAPTSVWDTAPFRLENGRGRPVQPAGIMANLANLLPPFQFPNLLPLRYHVFNVFPPSTLCLMKGTESSKPAHDQQFTALSYLYRCAMIKTVKNYQRIYVSSMMAVTPWLDDRKPSFVCCFLFKPAGNST